MPSASHHTIYITGATRGIGRALAVLYAQRGYNLALFARTTGGGEAFAGELRRLYRISARSYTCDVREAKQVQQAFALALEECGVPEVLILNAGVSRLFPPLRFDLAAVEAIEDLYQTNVFGALRCLAAVLPAMLQEKRGQIVGISSLAAYRSLGGKHAYAASKSALSAHLEGMRLSLYQQGIFVTTICPGFIKTDLTAKNKHPMPFLMELDQAAEKILKAIEHKRLVYNFPLRLYLLARLSKLLPERIAAWFMTRRSFS